MSVSEDRCRQLAGRARAAVVSTDGLILSSAMPVGADEDRIAAMAPWAPGERSSSEQRIARSIGPTSRAGKGDTILIQCGLETVLETIGGRATLLGTIDLKRDSQELARVA